MLPKILPILSTTGNSSFHSFRRPCSIVPRCPLFWDRLLVIVAVIVAVFLLKGNKEKPEIDNSKPNMTTDEIINTGKEDLPDKTEQEIQDAIKK